MAHRVLAPGIRRAAAGLGLLAAVTASISMVYSKAGAQPQTGAVAIQAPSARQDKNARRYSYFLIWKGSMFGMGSSEDYSQQDGKDRSDRLIVTRDKVKYEITDRSTIKAVADALEPVMKLGRQQGELGRQQGALGRKQGALGRRQGELGRKQGELARSMARAEDGARADFSAQENELARQQAELGRQQAELGRQQSALGRKQAELGRKQTVESRKADAKITSILDDAFARNLTHPLPQN